METGEAPGLCRASPNCCYLPSQTWLDKSKEGARQFHRYNNFFVHRKGWIGGGVGILTSTSISVSQLSSYTTSTLSAIRLRINNEKHGPIIIGCIYHPTNVDDNTTLNYVSTTLLKLYTKLPNTQMVIARDFNGYKAPYHCHCHTWQLLLPHQNSKMPPEPITMNYNSICGCWQDGNVWF